MKIKIHNQPINSLVLQLTLAQAQGAYPELDEGSIVFTVFAPRIDIVNPRKAT